MSETPQTKKPWSKWHLRLHKRLIQNNSLLPRNSILLLAISGGQDSMALLKLLFDLQRLYKWQIEVWHGDHQWHNQSGQIETELKSWCLHRQISFHSNKAQKEDVNNEAKARNWRYKNLIMKAKSLASNNINKRSIKILTGHTATDRAETIIMNLARGSDLIGLSSLREKRNLDHNFELVRPLLIFTREETLQICKELNLPIWLDPSNENLNFARNRIRKEILPILNSIHKGADLRIATLANKLETHNDDQIFFAKIAINFCKERKINYLSRKKIIKFPNSVRKIILNTWLKSMGVKKFTAMQIAEINNKIDEKKPPGSIYLHGNFVLSWNKERISIQ